MEYSWKSFFIIISLSNSLCANIGFFCNTGPYSHDAYTSYLARNAIQQGHNVTIIQIRVFNFKKVPFSSNFQNYILHDFSTDPETIKAQELSEQLMWELSLPYDIDNGSFIGIQTSLKIQESITKGCGSALENESFVTELKSLNLDLMLIDYTMNDCAIGLTSILGIPVAYISSVPLASNYMDYLGIPSNPSYVPVYFCNYEPYENFLDRSTNSLGYINLVGFRKLFYLRTVTIFYEKLNYKLKSLETLEPRTLIFATPWEMFFDMPRPIARNVKYFGCETCGGKIEFKNSNFTEEANGVILVSFGTLVNPEKIPIEKLQSFLQAFEFFPHYTFIWQLDVSQEYFEKTVLKPIKKKMPKHVQLYRWVPMKELLKDPKVILLITHGGATTSLEAAYSGVPILGIAIHSDQYYNTHRFAQRGLGRALTVTEISKDSVLMELNLILPQHKMYKSRARKFQEMLADYRELETSSSTFWINILTRHFIYNNDSKKMDIKLEKYWILKFPTNWLCYNSFDIIVFILLILYGMIIFYS